MRSATEGKAKPNHARKGRGRGSLVLLALMGVAFWYNESQNYKAEEELPNHPTTLVDNLTTLANRPPEQQQQHRVTRNAGPLSNKVMEHLRAMQPESTQSINSTTLPKIAWLLSFPNSGTTYTLFNTQQVTQRAIASNYAVESQHPPFRGQIASVDPSDPSRRSSQGPFVGNQYPLPSTFVLTKTHCAGYMGPTVVPTVDDFFRACHLLKRGPGHSYPFAAHRAIHLLRHPLDNLVARRNHQVLGSLQVRGKEKKEPPLTVELLKDYCQDDSSESRTLVTHPLLPPSTRQAIQQLPFCRVELFRYVQWHNRAVEMTTHHYHIPVHYVYYEDYGTQHDATVQGIVDFLQLPRVADPLPFESNKSYFERLFTPAEVAAVARFLEQVATPECWKLLQRYFVPADSASL